MSRHLRRVARRDYLSAWEDILGWSEHRFASCIVGLHQRLIGALDRFNRFHDIACEPPWFRCRSSRCTGQPAHSDGRCEECHTLHREDMEDDARSVERPRLMSRRRRMEAEWHGEGDGE